MWSRRPARNAGRGGVGPRKGAPLTPASSDRERTGRRDVRAGSGARPACRPTQGAAGPAQVSSRNAGARKPAVHEVETSQWGAKAQLRPAAGIQAEKMAFPVAFPVASGEV